VECSHPTSDNEKVLVELTQPEALVLFELLARWTERGSGDIHLDYQAEQRVLWDILAKLESALAEPLMPDYQDRLTQARQRVQDTWP
jgi:hypothetical protein